MRKVALLAAVGCGVMASTPVLADARDEVVASMMRCAVLTDDRQWLDCYYGAAQPMRAQLGLSPAPQAQLRLQAAQPKGVPLPDTVARAAVHSGPPPMPRKSSLLDVWGGDDVINNAPIKAYTVDRDGFTVTLIDGQVWQQTPDDAAHHPVFWREPASSMRVTISQAALHTFNLVLGDENIHHKVKRIR